MERAYADVEHPPLGLLRGELKQEGGDSNPAEALTAAFQQQMVVLGPPGAGKSTLAVLFILAALDQGTRNNPVPVLLPVAEWDPAEPIKDWCLQRISEDYPDFGANGKFNRGQIADLLSDGRIVPVLDGLDEMPVAALPIALDVLDRSAGAGLRMVLTCRSTEFKQTVQTYGPLSNAAVVEIDPVRAHLKSH